MSIQSTNFTHPCEIFAEAGGPAAGGFDDGPDYPRGGRHEPNLRRPRVFGREGAERMKKGIPISRFLANGIVAGFLITLTAVLKVDSTPWGKTEGADPGEGHSATYGQSDSEFEKKIEASAFPFQRAKPKIQCSLPECPCSNNVSTFDSGYESANAPAFLLSHEDRGFEASEIDDVTVIDIMVLYTPAAREQKGGTTNIGREIILAVDSANTAFRRSGVLAVIRLVHAAEINYTATNVALTDITRLGNPSDGHMDEAHALRDQFGADLVSLWTERSYGGIATTLTSSTPNGTAAYSVLGSAHSGLFIHEIGHNFGCGHAAFQSGSRRFDYSFGWNWTGTNGVQYRSVMAGGPGEWIHQFSNPDVLYGGAASGSASADNARTINETKQAVSLYRASVSDLPVIYPPKRFVPKAGGSFSFDVFSPNSWTLGRVPGDEWVNGPDAGASAGNKSLPYTVGANNGFWPRTAKIAVSGSVDSIFHTVTQAGELAPPSRVTARRIGKNTVQVRWAGHASHRAHLDTYTSRAFRSFGIYQIGKNGKLKFASASEGYSERIRGFRSGTYRFRVRTEIYDWNVGARLDVSRASKVVKVRIRG